MICLAGKARSADEINRLINEAKTKILGARDGEKLLCEKEVSAQWDFLSLAVLRNMRARGNGPKFLKFGQARNLGVQRLGDPALNGRNRNDSGGGEVGFGSGVTATTTEVAIDRRDTDLLAIQ